MHAPTCAKSSKVTATKSRRVILVRRISLKAEPKINNHPVKEASPQRHHDHDSLYSLSPLASKSSLALSEHGSVKSHHSSSHHYYLEKDGEIYETSDLPRGRLELVPSVNDKTDQQDEVVKKSRLNKPRVHFSEQDTASVGRRSSVSGHSRTLLGDLLHRHRQRAPRAL